MNDFNAPACASTLWAMGKTGADMPGIFEALGTTCELYGNIGSEQSYWTVPVAL